MKGPNWKLEGDYKSVTVTFPTDPPVVLKLDVADVEDMLRNLGEFRAAMKPEVPRVRPTGMVPARPDPIWWSEPDAMQGHSLLHIRDDRYGWLHYLLPPNEAKKLGQLLQTQAVSQPHSPSRNKAN